MDIHKPKAAHSLREFLVEIGTISVGILIALGLETAVEAFHDHERVAHARADLRDELAANRKALASTVQQERVSAAGLDVISRYAAARLAHRGAGPMPQVTIAVGFKAMNTAAWESTVATQALSHMPAEEAEVLSRAYSGSREFNEFEADAVRRWYELTTLDDLSTLSPADLKAALHEIRLNRAYSASILQAGSSLLDLYDKALAELR